MNINRVLCKELIVKIATALAILLASVVVFYALRFLIVGQEWLIIPETPPIEENSEILPQPKTVFSPYPVAIIPLIAATLLIIGVLWRKLLIAWIGLVGLAGFAILFLFSSGAVLLLLVGILLLLLGIVTIC